MQMEGSAGAGTNDGKGSVTGSRSNGVGGKFLQIQRKFGVEGVEGAGSVGASRRKRLGRVLRNASEEDGGTIRRASAMDC